MATQVDGTRRNVDVHQVVDDSALDVIEDAVDQVTATHVHDLDVGQISGSNRKQDKEVQRMFVCLDGSLVGSSPVQILIQRLVGRLVTLDPLHEVLDGLL